MNNEVSISVCAHIGDIQWRSGCELYEVGAKVLMIHRLVTHVDPLLKQSEVYSPLLEFCSMYMAFRSRISSCVKVVGGCFINIHFFSQCSVTETCQISRSFYYT